MVGNLKKNGNYCPASRARPGCLVLTSYISSIRAETGCPIHPALCAVAPAAPTRAMAGDAERLKRALAKELGWDLGTLDGIVEALQAAHGQNEVDEIVQDYLGGSTAVKEVVQVFLGTRRPAQPPQGAQAVGAPAQAMFNTCCCAEHIGWVVTSKHPSLLSAWGTLECCMPCPARAACLRDSCLPMQGAGGMQGRQGAPTRQVHRALPVSACTQTWLLLRADGFIVQGHQQAGCLCLHALRQDSCKS